MQRKTLVTSLITAGFFALGSLGASAATVSFNFDETSSATTTVAGLTVTVSDWVFASGSGTARTLTVPTGTGAAVVFDDLGLGMQSSSADNVLALRGSGTNPREAINFFFSSVVKLLSVTLTPRNGSTPMNSGVVFVDFDGDVEATDFATSAVLSTNSQTISFSEPAYTNQNIGIGAKGGAAFFISAISVDVPSDGPPPSPVPVPAAGLMLGSLALLPLLRRKRRAA